MVVTSSIEPMDPNWNEEKSWAGEDEEDGIAYRKSFSGKQNLFRVVRLGLGTTKLLYVVVGTMCGCIYGDHHVQLHWVDGNWCSRGGGPWRMNE